VSTSDESRSFGRHSRRLWYHLWVGAVAGATIIVFAVLPLRLGGVAGFVTVVVLALVDRVARRRFDPKPRGWGAVAYFVFGGLIYAGSLGLAVTVAHDTDALWVAWLLAGLVFAVFVSAAWVPNGHPRKRVVRPSPRSETGSGH
jgi:hypothetical protein